MTTVFRLLKNTIIFWCSHAQTQPLPVMIPLARPGIPLISLKLFEVKYLSQVAFSSGPSQKCFQMLVVFTKGGPRVGSMVGLMVMFSKRRKTECKQTCVQWQRRLVWRRYNLTYNSGEVVISSLLRSFDLHINGFCTQPVIKFMATDGPISQHAHTAKEKPTGLSKSNCQCWMFKNTKSMLTGNVEVWRQRQMLRCR